MTWLQPSARRLTRAAVLPITALGATVVVVAALAELAPEPVPHLPFWLLAVMFAIAGTDGYLGGDERHGLCPPAARIVLVIGLVFDLPLHLLAAQALGMAAVSILPDGRTAYRKLLDGIGSLVATGCGVVAFVVMSDAVPAQGFDMWLDAAVAGVVAIGVSHLIDVGLDRSASAARRAITRERAWSVARDGAAVATGLVIIELLRADLAAGWLLALPTVAVLLTRRRLADASARGAALLQMGEATAALRATTSPPLAARITAQQLAATTRALRVRVQVQTTGAQLVTAEVGTHELPRSWITGTVISVAGWLGSDAAFLRDRVVVSVGQGTGTIVWIRVDDRPGSSRIGRVHAAVIHLFADALRQQLQLQQQWEELRSRASQDRALAHGLRELNDELERTSSARSVFLATTSHELRAPLSALLAEAQVLDHLVPPDTADTNVRRLVEGVGENARHLLRMVDDLLAIARLEADRLEVASLPVDLVEIVQTVAETFQPMLASSGIDLQVTTPKRSPMVGDRDRLWQVIANLVDNAARVMPDGGSIHIEVRQTPAAAQLRITDTGPGIAVEELERLFAPFERGAVRGPGLGLGLAIARALVDRHGGTLAVSGASAMGTTFVADFPSTAQAPFTEPRELSPERPSRRTPPPAGWSGSRPPVPA